MSYIRYISPNSNIMSPSKKQNDSFFRDLYSDKFSENFSKNEFGVQNSANLTPTEETLKDQKKKTEGRQDQLDVHMDAAFKITEDLTQGVDAKETLVEKTEKTKESFGKSGDTKNLEKQQNGEKNSGLSTLEEKKVSTSKRTETEIRADLELLIREGGVELFFQTLKDFVSLKREAMERMSNEINKFEKQNRYLLLGKRPSPIISGSLLSVSPETSFSTNLEQKAKHNESKNLPSNPNIQFPIKSVLDFKYPQKIKTKIKNSLDFKEKKYYLTQAKTELEEFNDSECGSEKSVSKNTEYSTSKEFINASTINKSFQKNDQITQYPFTHRDLGTQYRRTQSKRGLQFIPRFQKEVNPWQFKYLQPQKKSMAKFILETSCSETNIDIRKNLLKDNTGILIKKLVSTFLGAQPEKQWMVDWSGRDRQVFWLLLSKVWAFSGDWAHELRHSNKFPSGKGKLVLSPKVQTAFYEKLIVRELLLVIFKDLKSRCGDQDRFYIGFDVFSLFEHLDLPGNFLKRLKKLVRSYYFVTRQNGFYSIPDNQKIKMEELDVVISGLSYYPGIQGYFRKVVKIYIDGDSFSKPQMVTLVQRISIAVRKIGKMIDSNKFPRVGMDLTSEQRGSMKKIKVFRPIEFWALCLKKVLDKLGRRL